MADDFVIDDSTPLFESIDDLHLRSVSSPPTTNEAVEMDMEDAPTIPIPPSGPRKRGRPKGSKNRVAGSLPMDPGLSTGVSGRLAKDVSLRAQQVFKGASSIPAIWRPYFQMHDIEAQNIADPLASYATRQAEISPMVAEFLDNFDLVAAVIGIGAYAVRVYKDNDEYIKSQRQQSRGTSGTRQAPMVNDRRSPTPNQPAQGSDQSAENGYVDSQPDVESDPNVPTISVPYVGNL